MLALSNEPKQLINMTLDTLAESLKTECCWVQTINTSEHTLQLAADRGFNKEMRRELSLMKLDNRFSEQIVGLGNEIVIPDLSNDGRYGLSSFRAAGYRWLVAVPLMTYRVHGILGIASRHKKRLHREVVDLITVVAGLIGTALNRSSLSRSVALPEKSTEDIPSPDKSDTPKKEHFTPEIPPVSEKAPLPEEKPTQIAEPAPMESPDSVQSQIPIIVSTPTPIPVKLEDDYFHRHHQKMKSFRSQHH